MPLIVTLTVNPAMDVSTLAGEVVPDHKVRCHDVRYDPGGGGVNVARALHHLGQAATPVLTAGGPPGDMIVSQLVAEGLAPMVVPIAGTTRSSFSVFEERSGRQYRFVLPGPEITAAERVAIGERLAAFEPHPEWLVVSGSLPPGVPDDYYAELALVAREREVRLVLDAAGEPLRLALEAGVYAVKPSLRELEGLVGRTLAEERDQEAACRNLVAQGRAQVVALSLGDRGGLLTWSGGQLRMAPPFVDAITTIGAGDSFTAGLTLGLARGLAYPELLRLAIAAGTAAVRHHGTQLCLAEDVAAMLAAWPA